MCAYLRVRPSVSFVSAPHAFILRYVHPHNLHHPTHPPHFFPERRLFEAERDESGIEVRVFVGNIAQSMSDDELRTYFAPFGTIKQCVIVSTLHFFAPGRLSVYIFFLLCAQWFFFAFLRCNRFLVAPGMSFAIKKRADYFTAAEILRSALSSLISFFYIATHRADGVYFF